MLVIVTTISHTTKRGRDFRKLVLGKMKLCSYAQDIINIDSNTRQQLYRLLLSLKLNTKTPNTQQNQTKEKEQKTEPKRPKRDKTKDRERKRERERE